MPGFEAPEDRLTDSLGADAAVTKLKPVLIQNSEHPRASQKMLSPLRLGSVCGTTSWVTTSVYNTVH